jgi:hypothetical protein
MLLGVLAFELVPAAQIQVVSPDGQPIAVTYPAPVVTCQPSSGSLFPVGMTTTVKCTAPSFDVTVTYTPPRFDWTRDTTYLGSFTVPHVIPNGTLEYNGGGFAYDAMRDGLFIGSRDADAAQFTSNKVAEISIPPIGGTATILQSFTEPTEGKFVAAVVAGTPLKISGLLVLGGTLCGVHGAYYDGDSAQTLSHWCRPSDLTMRGQVTGLFGLTTPGLVVKNPVRFTNTVLADVPEILQASVGGSALTGGCCVNISAGTSNGPAAMAWTPSGLAAGQVTVPLLAYPIPNVLNAWNVQSDVWNGTTQVAGMFVTGHSLVFVERHGIGPFCYGTGGAVRPADLPAGAVWCPDPADGSKGTHAYPYVYKALAYDLDALIAARAMPWTVKPYGNWNFEMPGSLSGHRLNGLAFDRLGHRLFVEQWRGDGTWPKIHVYQVKP